jgi:hypothetical protein
MGGGQFFPVLDWTEVHAMQAALVDEETEGD